MTPDCPNFCLFLSIVGTPFFSFCLRRRASRSMDFVFLFFFSSIVKSQNEIQYLFVFKDFV